MTTKVTKGGVAQVFTTKKGMYEFFVVEMSYYLPPLKYTNSEWLRDIAQGKKKVLKTKSANVAVCPQIEGMRIEDLVKFCKEHGIDEYLPGTTRGGKDPHYDRDYLLTIANTFKAKQYIEMRDKAIALRKKKMTERTQSEFEVLSEIATALKSTNQVAVGRGRAVHLLAGPPSKKRKLNELSNEDNAEMHFDPEQIVAENEQLRQALAQAQAHLTQLQNGGGVMSKLGDNGFKI